MVCGVHDSPLDTAPLTPSGVLLQGRIQGTANTCETSFCRPSSPDWLKRGVEPGFLRIVFLSAEGDTDHGRRSCRGMRVDSAPLHLRATSTNEREVKLAEKELRSLRQRIAELYRRDISIPADQRLLLLQRMSPTENKGQKRTEICRLAVRLPIKTKPAQYHGIPPRRLIKSVMNVPFALQYSIGSTMPLARISRFRSS